MGSAYYGMSPRLSIKCVLNQMKHNHSVQQESEPLSHYLFLLCAEGLSALIAREKGSGNPARFKACCDLPVYFSLVIC